MKNLRYIPFMRNRYYEGKLLTAEDFEQEQRYMNDKRRLHNRYFHGAGVVAGLEVIRVDDYSISLEMGAAIDGTGREIVVESPSIYKLSMIDGFEKAADMGSGGSLKLYIAYAEEEAEPVHNMMDQSVHTSEEPDYNKIRERYRLYVAGGEPEVLEPLSGASDHFSFVSSRAEMLEERAGTEGICLAGIDLVKAGEFYMIEKIHPMYGGQYAGCVPYVEGRVELLEQENAALLRRVEQLEKSSERSAAVGGEERSAGGGDSLENSWQLSKGSVRLPLGKRGRRGQTVFSGEIAHGLGLGNVDISLSVLNGDMLYGGETDIFGEREVLAACAYRINRGTGTFTIGIRLLEETVETEITVMWTALRNRRHEEIKKGEKRIYIDPSVINIGVRQEQKLHAVCVNMDGGNLIWSVEDPDGGEVDGEGLYHAPNHPGVYEITVCDGQDRTARASTFAVVREKMD